MLAILISKKGGISMSEMNIYFLVFIISIVINLICGFRYSIKFLKEKLKGAKEHDQDYFN